MRIGQRVAVMSLAAGTVVLLTSCAVSTSTGSPAAPTASATGVITGQVEGCFGYAGPPEQWPVTVTAREGSKVAATSVLTVHFASPSSNTDKGVTGNVYTLEVPPGTYDIEVAAASLIKPSPMSIGSQTVEAGQTVTLDMHSDCS